MTRCILVAVFILASMTIATGQGINQDNGHAALGSMTVFANWNPNTGRDIPDDFSKFCGAGTSASTSLTSATSSRRKAVSRLSQWSAWSKGLQVSIRSPHMGTGTTRSGSFRPMPMDAFFTRSCPAREISPDPAREMCAR
jgi:hypothetical protein